MDIVELLKKDLLDKLKAKTIYIGECWIYNQDSNIHDEYSRIFIADKTMMVHRVSASLFHGLDLDNQEQLACHKPECQSKFCWNPAHLYVGSHRDNMQDKKLKPCRYCGGPRNVVGRSMGKEYRYCRPCRMKRVRARRSKR